MSLKEIKENIQILEESIIELENDIECEQDEHLIAILESTIRQCREELDELKEEVKKYESRTV